MVKHMITEIENQTNYLQFEELLENKILNVKEAIIKKIDFNKTSKIECIDFICINQNFYRISIEVDKLGNDIEKIKTNMENDIEE